MPLFRHPIPRRAFAAAALGALYGLLLLPTPGPFTAVVNLLGVAWFLIAIGLLFLQPLSYHVFTTWALLWAVWKSVETYRLGNLRAISILLDIILPATAALLLMTSGYLAQAQAQRAAEES